MNTKRRAEGRLLRNGVVLPPVGYGSYRISGDACAAQMVCEAVKAGYRLIDTAACYGNEVGIGQGVRACGLPREALQITSKVWNTDRGYERTMAAFRASKERLRLDYLDLYLIHWPANALCGADWDEQNLSTWRALTALYRAGEVRAIGVSNFQPKHLASLMETDIPPMVNQIEFHPGFMQRETLAFCHQNGIVVQGWAPFGTAAVLQQHALAAVAQKCGRSTAQVCLRWAVQHGVLPLPKSADPGRMQENLDIFSFALDAADMEQVDALQPCGGSCRDSDKVAFL